MKNENIVDNALDIYDFTEIEQKNFKAMLNVVFENKRYGFPKDLRRELQIILERDELYEDK